MGDFEQQYEATSHSLLIGSLDVRDKPTIQGICRNEGSISQKLPDVFTRRTKDIINYCKENDYIVDDKLSPQIDFIYQCYASTRSSPPLHLREFSRSLDSFDSFVAHYARRASRSTIGNLMERIDRFTRTTLHPRRVITVFPENHRMHEKTISYQLKGRWILLPSEFGSGEEYVEKGVVEEILNLQKIGYKQPDLYHTTGSASLEGIAKHGALLSARRAIESEEAVKTGEQNTYIGWEDHSQMGGKKGLASVYTSKFPHIGYSVARWFDEYHVIFGLSRERITTYIQAHNQPDDRLKEFPKGEVRIGPEVPLELVDSIYGEHIYLKQLLEWKEKNAPQALVVSLEADDLLRRRTKRDWESIVRQKPIFIE